VGRKNFKRKKLKNWVGVWGKNKVPKKIEIKGKKTLGRER
jgi:hypothetical protein